MMRGDETGPGQECSWPSVGEVVGRSSLFAVAVALLAACAGDTGGVDDDDSEQGTQPLLVTAPASTMVEGFAAGRLRNAKEVPTFRITKHPITRAQYEACVAAGACTDAVDVACDPERDLGGLKYERKASPALCVGQANAHKYCKWIGGRLPTWSEWLYAARGVEPKPYAWGDDPPSCERHPRAFGLAPPTDGSDAELVGTARCTTIQNGGKLEVGRYAAAASPLGMEDVLITPAELLATEDGSLLSACSDAYPACLVRGSSPGLIEGLQPVRASGGSAGGADARETYSFRCVVKGK